MLQTVMAVMLLLLPCVCLCFTYWFSRISFFCSWFARLSSWFEDWEHESKARLLHPWLEAAAICETWKRPIQNGNSCMETGVEIIKSDNYFSVKWKKNQSFSVIGQMRVFVDFIPFENVCFFSKLLKKLNWVWGGQLGWWAFFTSSDFIY